MPSSMVYSLLAVRAGNPVNSMRYFMKIEIQKIKKESIFCDEFSDMIHNNIIDFSPCPFKIVFGLYSK